MPVFVWVPISLGVVCVVFAGRVLLHVDLSSLMGLTMGLSMGPAAYQGTLAVCNYLTKFLAKWIVVFQKQMDFGMC